MFNNSFPENRAFYEIIWKKKYGKAGQATEDNKMLRMRFACCVTESTYTHLEYVIIVALPRQ